MRKEMKYIGFYDLPNKDIHRSSSIAAVAKMDYICEVLNEIGYSVTIVSPSQSIEKKWNFVKGKKIEIDKNNTLILFPTFGTNSRFVGYARIVYSLTMLFFWLVFNVRYNETILVYHSPWLSIPVRFAKWLIGFKLILELEEIYSDVVSFNKHFDHLENKLIKNADAYILASDLLVDKIEDTKSFVVSYGRYKDEKILEFPRNDGKIHVVYAGVIDSITMEAYNAINAARFLESNYAMHIIGWGEIDNLQNKIPSILESRENESENYMVMNYFCYDDIFIKLKPRYYCLADPMFFCENHRLKDVKKLYSILETDVNWNMTLYIPASKMKEFKSFSRLDNPKIKVFGVNDTIFIGPERYRFKFYDKNLAMMPIGTVANLAIFTAIKSGCRLIKLYGVDHSFFEGLLVDDSNRLMVKLKHFYSDTENLRPIIRNTDDKPHTISSYLQSLLLVYQSHDLLYKYAKTKKVKILNCTINSFIDSYEKITRK